MEAAHRHRKGAGDSLWAQREHRYNMNEREARRQAILTQLRTELPEGDRGLVGWDQIGEFLTGLCLRSRYNGPVTPQVAQSWFRRLALPVLPGSRGVRGLYRSSPPMATAYALTAWALSLNRSGGMTMPRASALPPVPDKRRISSGDRRRKLCVRVSDAGAAEVR